MFPADLKPAADADGLVCSIGELPIGKGYLKRPHKGRCPAFTIYFRIYDINIFRILAKTGSPASIVFQTLSFWQ